MVKVLKNPEKEDDILWAKTVKTRDNYQCVICGSNEKPNAHHIIPRENKEYKLNIDNGITLCVKHHKFSRDISAHNNPLAFFIWLERNNPGIYIMAKARQQAILEGLHII